MATEEDGDEVFVPIVDVRHCRRKLRPMNGFWKCPVCEVSFGPVADEQRSHKCANEPNEPNEPN